MTWLVHSEILLNPVRGLTWFALDPRFAPGAIQIQPHPGLDSTRWDNTSCLIFAFTKSCMKMLAFLWSRDRTNRYDCILKLGQA